MRRGGDDGAVCIQRLPFFANFANFSDRRIAGESDAVGMGEQIGAAERRRLYPTAQGKIPAAARGGVA